MSIAKLENELIVKQTRHWVETIIIGNNFCPFASKPLQDDSIRFAVVREIEIALCLQALLLECEFLDNHPGTTTTLVIFPEIASHFTDYLFFLELSEDLLIKQQYAGIYQLASFHPEYCFAETPSDSPTNFTNRSPYPILHLLREESIERAVASYPQTDTIPQRNIAKAKELGTTKLQSMLQNCITVKK